nr:retrovirus-related Pol polyprotein LINE-1 [Tanacetum cinerariifolium]
MRDKEQANRTAADERYKEANREAKQAVARAKGKAYEYFYKRLDSKYGENDIYRIAKARERSGKSISPPSSTVKGVSKPKKWKVKVKTHKTTAIVGESDKRKLRRHYERWVDTRTKMPDEWRLGEVIPIYKNERETQTCSNYRGINLLIPTMKIKERVIERRLRREAKVSENQFSLCWYGLRRRQYTLL